MSVTFRKPKKFCSPIPDVVETLMDCLPDIPSENEHHEYQGDLGSIRYMRELEQTLFEFFNCISDEDKITVGNYLNEHQKQNKLFFLMGLYKGVEFGQNYINNKKY